MTDPTQHGAPEIFNAAAKPEPRDPGPICFLCGERSPDSVHVEVLAWTREFDKHRPTTQFHSTNICAACLKNRADLAGQRLGHDIAAHYAQWRGRQARKRPRP